MSSGESTEREWRDRAWAAEERASIAEAEVARIKGYRVLCRHHYDNGPDDAVTGNLGCPICLMNERDSLGERNAAAEADLRLATEQGDRYLAASKAASRERWDAVAERDALGERIAALYAHPEALPVSWRMGQPEAVVFVSDLRRALDEGAAT